MLPQLGLVQSPEPLEHPVDAGSAVVGLGMAGLLQHAPSVPTSRNEGKPGSTSGPRLQRGAGEGEELAGLRTLRQIPPVLPDEQTSPEQFEAYRRMTPERRLALAEQLYWTARELKAAWLRSLHPDWSEEHVAREVTRIFLHART